MTVITTILGVLILICALFLIASVLLQSSKNHRMSGVVSGGAETFFGKQKGKTIDAKLSKATAIIAVLFAVLVLSLYFVNAYAQKDNTVIGSDVTTEQTGETGTTETDTTETDTTETDTTETDTTETDTTETEGETESETVSE